MARSCRGGPTAVLLRRGDPSDDVRRCSRPNHRRHETPRLERSFASQLRGPSCLGTRRGLCLGDLGVMRATQDLETAVAARIGQEVMMTTRTVPITVSGSDVVDLAVAPCGRASGAGAAVFRTALCRRAGESPDVLTLPGTAAFVRAPGTTARRVDGRVAPLASANLAGPLGECARDAFGNEWWKRHRVNGAFRVCAFRRHFRVKE